MEAVNSAPSQSIRLFPEDTGIYTRAQALVWFKLLRVLHQEGCELNALKCATQKTDAFWFEAPLWDLVRPHIELNSPALAATELVSRPFTSSEAKYACLAGEEMLTVYRLIEATGKLPQVLEQLEATDVAIWVTPDITNRTREYLLRNKLFLVDRSVRSVMITQTCQCRGKS